MRTIEKYLIGKKLLMAVGLMLLIAQPAWGNKNAQNPQFRNPVKNTQKFSLKRGVNRITKPVFARIQKTKSYDYYRTFAKRPNSVEQAASMIAAIKFGNRKYKFKTNSLAGIRLKQAINLLKENSNGIESMRNLVSVLTTSPEKIKIDNGIRTALYNGMNEWIDKHRSQDGWRKIGVTFNRAQLRETINVLEIHQRLAKEKQPMLMNYNFMLLQSYLFDQVERSIKEHINQNPGGQKISKQSAVGQDIQKTVLLVSSTPSFRISAEQFFLENMLLKTYGSQLDPSMQNWVNYRLSLWYQKK